jgi:hypothetical protein
MTPKQKARNIIEKFNLIVLDTALGGSNTRVKKCALIAVEEIINEDNDFIHSFAHLLYWKEVKQEIQNL